MFLPPVGESSMLRIYHLQIQMATQFQAPFTPPCAARHPKAQDGVSKALEIGLNLLLQAILHPKIDHESLSDPGAGRIFGSHEYRA